MRELFHLVLFTFVITACGNPHLRELDPDRAILPVIAAPSEKSLDSLQAPAVSNTDEDSSVRIKTDKESEDKKLEIVNPNKEEELTVSYQLEIGKEFSFSSIDCVDTLKSLTPCSLNLVFSSSTVGVFKDNLIVTYSSKKDVSDSKQVRIPLVGERILADTKPSDLEDDGSDPSNTDLKIVPNLGSSAIDFGKSVVGEKVSQLIVLENTGKKDIRLLSSSISSPEDFILGNKGTCKHNLISKDKCTVEVIFLSNKEGIKQSEIRISYSSLDSDAMETSAKLIGEKFSKNSELAPGKIEIGNIKSSGIDFGIISLNSSSKMTVPLYNVGETPLDLMNLSLEGNDFILSHSCGKTLLPGSCSLEVVFPALKEGQFLSNLVVETTDGQKIMIPVKAAVEKQKECFKKNTYHVDAMGSHDFSKIVLPYKNSASNTTARMVNLYGTKVNSYIRSLNRYTVKDAQVVTSFRMPDLKGRIVELDINLDVSKVVLDGYKDTEMFCISTDSIQKCSGNDFRASNFYALRNDKFWVNNVAPVNAIYEENFMSKISRCGSYDCSSFKGELSMIEMLELNRKELRSIKALETLNIIITDDTRSLSLPKLKVVTKEKINCSSVE